MALESELIFRLIVSVQLSKSILFHFLNEIKIIHRIFHYYVLWVKLFFKREFLTNDLYGASKLKLRLDKSTCTKNSAKSKKRFDEEGPGMGTSKGETLLRRNSNRYTNYNQFLTWSDFAHK